MPDQTLQVSDLLALAKGALDRGTGPVWVVGELTGFRRHQPSGHLYFEMKDGKGRICCVQWRDSARRIRFSPADGMQVRAHGRLGIYEPQGRLQLYVDTLLPAGFGELQAALERLKQRLAAEGLFAPERKRPIPRYPLAIGVATSPAGAAVRDILRVLGERWPVAEVWLCPCAVQGEGAAAEIVRSLRHLERLHPDVILLARGGGSIEDLWPFNEEPVVRAVAACSIPILTGVGHEIDVTLADFAADVRAATPSQAAELAVPSKEDVGRLLASYGQRLGRRAGERLATDRLRWARLRDSHGLRRPLDLLRQKGQRIDELAERAGQCALARMRERRRRTEELAQRLAAKEPRRTLARAGLRLHDLRGRMGDAAARRLARATDRLRGRAAHLEAVGPHAVLARGYAIALRARDGRAVRGASEVETGEKVRLLLGTGELGCRVEERIEPAAGGETGAPEQKGTHPEPAPPHARAHPAAPAQAGAGEEAGPWR
ncbi:MAG: exodeoxyribonuclease VII large subunit [Candidatus Eisenbacteria bacterium]